MKTSRRKDISEDTKTIVTVLLLIFFLPVGIIFMWLWMQWPKWLKILLTAVPIFFFVTFLISAISIPLLVFKNEQNQKVVSSTLNKYETDKYIFYYPENFLKKNEASDTYFAYHLPNGTVYTIFYKVQEEKWDKEYKISQGDCDKSAPDWANKIKTEAKAENSRVIESKVIDRDNSYGCTYKISSSGSHPIFTKIAVLFYKKGSDFSKYSVETSYSQFLPQDQANTLDLAISKFTLK